MSVNIDQRWKNNLVLILVSLDEKFGDMASVKFGRFTASHQTFLLFTSTSKRCMVRTDVKEKIPEGNA